jgi:hypothetical protein
MKEKWTQNELERLLTNDPPRKAPHFHKGGEIMGITPGPGKNVVVLHEDTVDPGRLHADVVPAEEVAQEIAEQDKPIDPNLPEFGYSFAKGVWIEPFGHKRGELIDAVKATRTDQHAHGLKHTYTALGSFRFWQQGGPYLTLHTGTQFTAPSLLARKFRLRKKR